MAPPHELDLVGKFELRVWGEALELSPASKRLLAFLALRSGPVNRLELAELLWPNRAEDRAMANLRAFLWRLGPVREEILQIDTRSIGLADTVSVDIVGLHRSCRTGLRNHRRTDLFVRESQLLEDLLPCVTEPWVRLHQERWRQLRLHVLLMRAEHLLGTGRLDAAEALLDRARAREPRHEALAALAYRVAAQRIEGGGRSAERQQLVRSNHQEPTLTAWQLTR